MRILKWSAAIAAIGVLAVGCSDDGDNATSAASQGTFDLSGTADTPFCQDYVNYLRALEQFVKQGGDDENLYKDVQSTYATATASSPPEIHLVMEAANAQPVSLDAWQQDIINAGPDDLEAAGKEVVFVTANCSIKSEAFGKSLQGS